MDLQIGFDGANPAEVVKLEATAITKAGAVGTT